MGKYRPGTLDDYAVIRRRNAKTRRQAENANAPTGSNVFSTTEKVQDSVQGREDLEQVVAALESTVASLSAAVSGQNAPGSCVVTNGSAPALPGSWVKVGTLEAQRPQGSSPSTRTLTVYERIEDDGDD